jgi:uncharacterized protein
MADEEEVVEVPHTALSAAALRGVVEEFVTRSGTDYGLLERDLESKVADVMRQLARGEVIVVFAAARGSVNIVPVPRPRRR